MYIWISKATDCGVGFGMGKSDDDSLVDFPIDELTFKELTAHPSKIKWARRVVESGVDPYIKFVIPTPVTRVKVMPVKIRRSALSRKDDPTLSLILDKSNVLHIASDCEIPKNAELVLCTTSAFNPRMIVKLCANKRPYPSMRSVLEDPQVHAYILGVPPHWTIDFLAAD